VTFEGEGICQAVFWERLLADFPSLASLRGSVRVAKNCEYLAEGEDFRPGDEAALIPPVSGG
jgi:molybdopterin converting factor small subunit